MFDAKENYDVILPEGFDPELGDANFDEEGNLVDAPAPTTEPGPSNTESPAEQGQTAGAEQTTTPAPDSVPPTQESAPVPQTIKVKFNHEERELSYDEAALYAQKGMNFDKIQQRAKEQEARLSAYDERAKLFGFDNADVMMEQAEKNFIDSQIQDLVQQGNTEAMARFLVTQKVEKLKSEIKPKEQSPQGTDGLPDREKKQIQAFATAYPGVVKIPDEVFELHAQGLDLVTAYKMHENNRALKEAAEKAKATQAELQILKQNQAAADRAPVVGTTGASTPPNSADDPFVKGFDAGL